MAGGIVPPSMVAQVCEYGAMGSLATGYLSLEVIAEQIDQIQSQTHRPFAVNLFVDYGSTPTTTFRKPDGLIALEQEAGLDAPQTYQLSAAPPMDALIALMLEKEVPVVSTTFGLLSGEHVDALKSAAIKLFTTVNHIGEIEPALETQQSDALVFQSALAGGHRGGFSEAGHSDIHAFTQRLSDLSIPVIYAGGLSSADDIRQHMQQGYAGVQVGSALISTVESSAAESYKQALISQGHDRTCQTTAITGKTARGLSNAIANMVLDNNPGFPHMHYATAALRQHAKANGLMAYQSLWAGANAYQIQHIDPLKSRLETLCAAFTASH